MKSMTGYGYVEEQDEKLHLSLEIKSYNNRYLDIIINQPAFLNPIESELRKYVSDRTERGRIEVYLRMRELEEDLCVHVDKAAVSVYADALRQIADAAGIEAEIKLSDLVSVEGLMKSEKRRDIEEYRPRIMALIERCFEMYDSSRIAEGLVTAGDIENSLDAIDGALALFTERSEEMEQNIKDLISTKFRKSLATA